MSKFYITFAERYRNQVHPLCGSDVTPDGFVTAHADSLEEAHRIAHREFNAYYDRITTELPNLPEGNLWTLS